MWREGASGPPCNPCCFYLLAWHVEDRLKGGDCGCSQSRAPCPLLPCRTCYPHPHPGQQFGRHAQPPCPCRPGATGQVSHKELSVWAARWPVRLPPRRDSLPSRVHPPPPPTGPADTLADHYTRPWAGASWGGVRPWPKTPTPARVDLCHLATQSSPGDRESGAAQAKHVWGCFGVGGPRITALLHVWPAWRTQQSQGLGSRALRHYLVIRGHIR